MFTKMVNWADEKHGICKTIRASFLQACSRKRETWHPIFGIRPTELISNSNSPLSHKVTFQSRSPDLQQNEPRPSDGLLQFCVVHKIGQLLHPERLIDCLSLLILCFHVQPNVFHVEPLRLVADRFVHLLENALATMFGFHEH